MKTRIFLKTFALSLALLGWSSVSWSQAYPAKPVKFVVPFPAGSATDQAASYVHGSIVDVAGGR